MNNPVSKVEVGDVIRSKSRAGAYVITRTGRQLEASLMDESTYNLDGTESLCALEATVSLIGVARIISTIQVGDIISTGHLAGGDLLLVRSVTGSDRQKFVRATKFNESGIPSEGDVVEFHMMLPWFTTGIKSVLLWGRLVNDSIHRTDLPTIAFNRG